MHHVLPNELLIATEQRLLRILCRTGTAVLQPERLASLRQNSWASTDHRVVFDALLRLTNVPPHSLRARLPAEATRMGFPDIAWDAYFESANGTNETNDSDENVAQVLARVLTESVNRR